MNKKRFLKSILATSALAAAIAPSAALGAVATVDGGANHGQTNAASAATWQPNAVPDTGDTLTFGANNDQISINHAANKGAFAIDIAGKSGTKVNIGLGMDGHSITSFANAHANKDLTLLAGDTKAFSISATGNMNALGLGTVDFNNKALNITLTPGAKNAANYTGVAFQSTGGDNGTLTVGTGTVTLGTFAAGGKAVDNLVIADGATAITSANIITATSTTVAGDGVLRVSAGHETGLVDGAGANEGRVEFVGASPSAQLGTNTALRSITTGNGMVTLNVGETKTKSLVLGNAAGGITTDQNLTVGADGVTGAGKLAFTADGNELNFAGDHAATGDIAPAHNLVIRANGNAVRTISAPIKPTAAGKTITFTNDGGGANGRVILNANIGAAGDANNPADVILTGAHDRIQLGEDVTIHATNVTAKNAGSAIVFAKKDANIKGAIRANGDNNGIILLEGTGTAAGSKDMLLDTGTKTFGNFQVADAARDSTVTIGSGNAPTTHKIQNLNFGATGDNSGLIIDLSNMNAGHDYGLTTTAAATVAQGSNGMIKFTGNNASKITLTLGGDFGADNSRKLRLLDSTNNKLTIAGAGNNMHVETVEAAELTLNNTNLGVYTSLNTDKLIITTANSSLLQGTNLKDNMNLHFNGNHTLTLGQAVNFSGSITTENVGTQGKVVLGKNGTMTVTSVGTEAKPLESVLINTGAAGEVATIKSSGSSRAVHHADFYGFAADGTLNFEGDLKGHIASAGNNGTLVLQGGNITKSVGVDSAALGNAKTLTEVRVDTTETVTIGSDNAGGWQFNAGKTYFAKDGALKFDTKLTGNLVTGAITTAVANTGSLEFNQDAAPASNVGESGKALKSVKISGGSTLSVADNKNYFVTNTDSGDAGANNVTFLTGAGNKTDATGSSFGVNKAIDTTTVGAGTVTLDNLYTKDLANAGTLNLKMLNITNEGTGAGTLVLLDGGSAVQSTGNKLVAGNLTTKGSATIGGNIGGTLTLQGANADKVVNFAGDTIDTVVADASTFRLAKDTTATTSYTGNNATLDLDANKLTSAAVAFAGNSTLVVKPGAQIASDAITLAAETDTLNLKIRGGLRGDITLFTKADGTAVAPTIVANGNEVADANFVLDNASNPFYGAVTHKAGKLTLAAQTDINKAATQGIVANANATSLIKQVMNYVKSSGAQDQVVGQLMDAYSDMRPEDRTEAITRLAEQHIDIDNIAGDSLHEVGNLSNSRMIPVFASTQTGVAAGDAADRYGAYVKGSFGTATQKFRKDTSGYKSNKYGAFVGVDAAVSDNVSVGVVAGYNASTIKHKDVKAGDKTKANSLMFAAYGTYDFGNNYFAQANAAVAQTTVKADSKRVLGGGVSATARGKYDVMAYNTEVRGGYKFRFDNSVLVPTAGLRFSHLGDTSYTETGAGLQNLKYSGKARSGLDAVAGVMLSTTLDMDGMVMQPEVHMNVDYKLSNSAPKADYNLDTSAIKFHYTGAKAAKFGYNFGASVMAQNDNMEYGAGYDARIADKYLGHQGSVKVRLNF